MAGDTTTTIANTGHGADILSDLGKKLGACMQCGTCSGSCGSSHAMDLQPRELWRLVQLGMAEDVFESKTFWLCSSCYYCTLRCPRGLPLTDAMAALKYLAMTRRAAKERMSPLFYGSFARSIRLYGRVREFEMMAEYLLRLGNPVTAMAFAPMGLKLLVKGKVSVHVPNLSGKGKLDAIFRKAREIEAAASAP